MQILACAVMASHREVKDSYNNTHSVNYTITVQRHTRDCTHTQTSKHTVTA